VPPRTPILPEEEPPAGGPDLQLERVAARLRGLDPDGSTFAEVLRDTLDQLLDGQRTGRYAETELRKTEKTHMGTLVEINLHRAFDFDDGSVTDYRIAGIEVDCKFSRTFGGWEIPLEAYGYLCLVVWADDAQSLWSAGLVRIQEELLLTSQNRDRKRRLNRDGLEGIYWLHRDAPLPPNLLLHLPSNVRDAIFSHRSGQSRVVELFRLVQGRVVPRTAVLTVAQQKDAPKRVRDARRHLRREGVVILGHQGDHPRVARALNLPVPKKGEWISARLAPTAPRTPESVVIARDHYRLADTHDPPTKAPLLDSSIEATDE
jgi:hypothetical protein